jgi:RHS repeat-associated protein
MLTDSTGAVTDTYDYDAFGNLINTTGSTPNVYLYRGEQFDPDLGLYYLRARYYNPVTGRFLTRDPGAGRISVPATLHKYLYAAGDPVNQLDPTGNNPTAVAKPGPGAIEYTLLLGVTLSALAPIVRTGGQIRVNWEQDDKVTKCAAGYVKCTEQVPGGGERNSGNVWGTSHCKTCMDVCMATGNWPPKIPYMGGARSCGPGPD